MLRIVKGSLHGFYLIVLRKSFYIRWSAGRSPQVHEVNPGRDPSFLIRVGTEAEDKDRGHDISHQ